MHVSVHANQSSWVLICTQLAKNGSLQHSGFNDSVPNEIEWQQIIDPILEQNLLQEPIKYWMVSGEELPCLCNIQRTQESYFHIIFLKEFIWQYLNMIKWGAWFWPFSLRWDPPCFLPLLACYMLFPGCQIQSLYSSSIYRRYTLVSLWDASGLNVTSQHKTIRLSAGCRTAKRSVVSREQHVRDSHPRNRVHMPHENKRHRCSSQPL